MEGFDYDDFGELYATDIQLPAAILVEEEEKADANSDSVNLEQEKNESENDDCVASDSDDDDGLKIVLNDDDFPVGVVACDVEGDTDEAKCGRSQGGSIFVNKSRWNGDTSIQNASSSSHVTRMCATANPVVVQCRYGSFLPWYWGIFDVNVDTLIEKLWKAPGADITDYFNFGFDESTWKQYCGSLEQLWQTSLQTGISVDDSAIRSQEAIREQTDQVGPGNVPFPLSDCGLPKGRAIQVEDSMIERQPSIDVRRPRNRDSNIIEIKLLESSDDYSGSGNSIVVDASLEGESIVGNNRSILNSSSERDEVLSEDQLEDVKKSEDSSVQKRSGLIPGVDGDEHQDQANQHSEDIAEVSKGEIKAEEGGGVDTCSSYPCWIESELSLGDQEHSLTSYTDSDSEATENSVHGDNDKSLSPLKRKSMNPVIDMEESLSFYCKNSKKNSFTQKTLNVTYNARTRGPFRKKWRNRSGRNEPGYNLNKHIENGNDISTFRSSARDLSLLDCQIVDYDRHKEQLQIFGRHKSRDVSYNRETKESYHYAGENIVDDPVTQRSQYYRKIVRENTNRYDRENGDVEDYSFRPGTRIADSEGKKREWYHPGWGYSADDLSPCSYRESRWFLPKHSYFPDKEQDTQRRRMDDMSQSIDRNCINDFDECEFDFLNKSYRMSTSVAEREMESLDNKLEEQFQHINRDWRRSAQRKRHCDRPPLFLENSCSGKKGDDCHKYTHYQTSNFKYRRQSYTHSVRNYAYDARVNEYFGGHGRHKHARDYRVSNWCGGYADAAEDEDFTIYPVEKYQFYRYPSKFLNWTEDEIVCRHHEAHAASLHAKVQTDDMKLQQHQLNMPRRRASEKHLKGTSMIMCRSNDRQAALRCRKSVHLINVEGKSHVRSSRARCNGRLEYVDQGIAKKRRASVSFDEPHKKISKFDTANYESDHENKKWFQKLPDQGQKESSDIEEGQIVTEEPYMEASVSRRDVSEGVAVTDSVKKRISQNENSSDQFTGGYDSQRILDSLAKMEKRRQRFKQPITMKKEAEESLKFNNDSIVDTGEMKQHRPARKRRWTGN